MQAPAVVVLTNCPDQASAERIAQLLVEQRLAACVNILAPVRSYYRWEGQLEAQAEVPLLIKTLAVRYGELEAAITEHHPYSVPEIIALPITAGWAPYLHWVEEETQKRFDV